LSSGNRLYVEDKVPVERRIYDPEQRVVWESRILRFGKDGQFLDFLGQEGIGGTPFPSLERLTLTNNGDIVVTCRTGRGWQVWWYDSQGVPLAQYQLDLTQLPVPKGTQGLIPQLETLFPDWSLRELHLKIDYYQETMDATTSTASGIQVVESLVWIWDLDRNTFAAHYGVPLLKRTATAGSPEVLLGDRPWEFVGVNEAGAGFFVSSPENHSQRFLVLNRAGETLLERNIELAGADSLFAHYAISPKGILAAFLSDGSGAEIAWWRSDKLLGSYVKTGL